MKHDPTSLAFVGDLIKLTRVEEGLTPGQAYMPLPGVVKEGVKVHRFRLLKIRVTPESSPVVGVASISYFTCFQDREVFVLANFPCHRGRMFAYITSCKPDELHGGTCISSLSLQ